ncbi:unnamed protein product [Effrenium voratum]|nr:unnamed protein product [Effrenium voratum]
MAQWSAASHGVSTSDVDDLSGLLVQHLSELDSSLAMLSGRSASEPGLEFLKIDQKPPPHTPRPDQSHATQEGPEFLHFLPPPPAHLAMPERPKFQPEQMEPSREPSRRDNPELLESLLSGIEMNQLSISDALSSLEKSWKPKAQPSEQAQVVQVQQAQQAQASKASKQINSDGSRCHCGVLGLQVRALAQSLAGLGASIVQWSRNLVHRRQIELVHLVLDYVQPLEHVDARLEALCNELSRDLAKPFPKMETPPQATQARD